MMEFHPSHHTAITLAGTVALPSPYPASGPVSVVVARDGDDFEVFVKILQVVSDKRIITRFVRPEDVRAIRAHPGDSTMAGPESWPVRGIKKIKEELDRRADDLRARARKTGILDEAPWYPSAIVYVAEAAPVLHRDEVGVTAAVSCEEVGFGIYPTANCCHIAVRQPCGSFADWSAAPAAGQGHEIPSGCCHVADKRPGPERRSGKDRS